ncbi:hypothetical protein [Nocardia brasiliensis]|uniref:hypothetical protein n=1 Tax=Nocardia brasiliensis TaxID=37326 RepID=UPI002454EBCF|nr:hypothetical protein [Nocardia brasiliensis]
MIVVATAEQRHRWGAQPCTDAHIEGFDHARFELTSHSGHGCGLFLAALNRTSTVMR